MEKDRTRRYDTAAGLADDVQRYLHDDAITARPPSLVYRSIKFARRHRTATVTPVLVVVSLVLGCHPDRRGEVEDLVKDMLDDLSAFLRGHALYAMWPVWDADEIRSRAASNPISAHWHGIKCWEYVSGRIDEAELLEQVDNTIPARLHAQFALAAMSLAAGKRQDARRHLEACVAMDGRGWFDYEWACGYLALMDAPDNPRFGPALTTVPERTGMSPIMAGTLRDTATRCRHNWTYPLGPIWPNSAWGNLGSAPVSGPRRSTGP